MPVKKLDRRVAEVRQQSVNFSAAVYRCGAHGTVFEVWHGIVLVLILLRSGPEECWKDGAAWSNVRRFMAGILAEGVRRERAELVPYGRRGLQTWGLKPPVSQGWHGRAVPSQILPPVLRRALPNSSSRHGAVQFPNSYSRHGAGAPRKFFPVRRRALPKCILPGPRHGLPNSSSLRGTRQTKRSARGYEELDKLSSRTGQRSLVRPSNVEQTRPGKCVRNP